jgi:hypothetical protein
MNYVDELDGRGTKGDTKQKDRQTESKRRRYAAAGRVVVLSEYEMWR